MELAWIWKSILIVVVGTVLLRLAGRKSIAQMTVAQTIIMIAIGSLLIQPVSGKSIWTTFAVAALLIATLLLMEYSQLKFNLLEKFFTGKSKIIIDNGVLQEETLKKLRLTVDQLEMQLRQNNVTKIENVKMATLEPNGKIGFVLKEDAQPATKEDIQKLYNLINTTMNANSMQLNHNAQVKQDTIFTELKQENHHLPEKLQ
ncbi:Uncharacterized membrane protein YcaP, DUF421 family [Desulfonispora thiosulfatigenes DSM 11270]|uniref:Uncharacterized membrane protein YcaP, DUF421 family n=1 Tax=Desulfonispora thiosulfatigenes DSM 11270 TaxID=656914 RepID=A0A1W1VGP8_DESTI|nr:YetF domain-containing protein [Desulfonispora thiosulfatigenes]SMB92542.1 Uncharacterized membrane protein YcaP, DUF421 family [Desulfonispora thiosulfatigenes DSM 11270]